MCAKQKGVLNGPMASQHVDGSFLKPRQQAGVHAHKHEADRGITSSTQLEGYGKGVTMNNFVGPALQHSRTTLAGKSSTLLHAAS